MGDWYEKPDGSWFYDKAAPSPGPTPDVTSMLPTVPNPNEMPPETQHRHGGTES